jgi:hypothetical protein
MQKKTRKNNSMRSLEKRNFLRVDNVLCPTPWLVGRAENGAAEAGLRPNRGD